MSKPYVVPSRGQLSRAELKRILISNDTDPAAAAAVALLEALIRFMVERGLMSEGDLDDVLAEAKTGQDHRAAVWRIIDAVGASAAADRK